MTSQVIDFAAERERRLGSSHGGSCPEIAQRVLLEWLELCHCYVADAGKLGTAHAWETAAENIHVVWERFCPAEEIQRVEVACRSKAEKLRSAVR